MVEIPKGGRRVWRNGGEDELHFLVGFRPALRTEAFIKTFFGLAKDGKTGLPNLLDSGEVSRS